MHDHPTCRVCHPNVCAYCGKNPAEGFATIAYGKSERRYCHEGTSPTCYERASLSRTTAGHFTHMCDPYGCPEHPRPTTSREPTEGGR